MHVKINGTNIYIYIYIMDTYILLYLINTVFYLKIEKCIILPFFHLVKYLLPAYTEYIIYMKNRL